jgi:hypothetical protein
LEADLQLDEEEDLSYASMFALGLDHHDSRADYGSLEPAARAPIDAAANGSYFERAAEVRWEVRARQASLGA